MIDKRMTWRGVILSEGKKRKLPSLQPEETTKTLPGAADKLFFLLSCLKNHSLQQFQAASFDISQTKVSQWVKVLHPLLQDSLRELSALPQRQGLTLTSLLAKYDGEAFTMYVTEPRDNQQILYCVLALLYTTSGSAIRKENTIRVAHTHRSNNFNITVLLEKT